MIDKRATTVNEAIHYLNNINDVIGSVRNLSKDQRKKFIEAQEYIYAAVCSLRKGISKTATEEDEVVEETKIETKIEKIKTGEQKWRNAK